MRSDAECEQFFFEPHGRRLAGIIAVVGNPYLFDRVFLKRLPVIVRKSIYAVAGRHVAEPRAPERQRVDDRLAQDDLFRRHESFFVPHAAMRSR